jgi:hypothetical protein
MDDKARVAYNKMVAERKQRALTVINDVLKSREHRVRCHRCKSYGWPQITETRLGIWQVYLNHEDYRGRHSKCTIGTVSLRQLYPTTWRSMNKRLKNKVSRYTVNEANARKLAIEEDKKAALNDR